jgi:hypothetical protein
MRGNVVPRHALAFAVPSAKVVLHITEVWRSIDWPFGSHRVYQGE